MRLNLSLFSVILRRLLTSLEFSAGKTINTLYAIDPARNSGVDYQYVFVRGKEQRRQMNTGECNCCRDVSVSSFSSLLLSHTDALDSPTKPLASSPIAYDNHCGAHLPGGPAHDSLTKTFLLRHLHPHPAAIKVLVPPVNAR